MSDLNASELSQMWQTLPPVLKAMMAVVVALLAVCAVVSIVVSIYLWIAYHKYNKKQNSINQTGEEIARKVLDDHGLQKIAVKCSGSFLFGNSYSHYYKKVRLRRMTWKKASVSSLAMAVQKSCLAILDDEKDPDMQTRVRLTPFIYIGPIACIPLILIGIAIDALVLKGQGIASALGMVLGLGFYALSFVMSIKVLKTEVKAQERAYQVARESALANEDEISDMKALFRLYNIEYINNMITALLEMILRVLSIVAKLQSNSSSSSSD